MTYLHSLALNLSGHPPYPESPVLPKTPWLELRRQPFPRSAGPYLSATLWAPAHHHPSENCTRATRVHT